MANLFGTEIDIPFIQNPFTNPNQGKIAVLQKDWNGWVVPPPAQPQQNPQINDLGTSQPQGNSGQYQSTSSSGGSSRGVAARSVDPAAMAYYQDQINQVNGALGRIGNQRNIGNQNIDSSYNAAFNKLVGQNAAAERDYGVKRQGTIDDNVAARAKVDQNVSRQSAGLRRLLGNSSSAALFAAPRAVANEGNTQLGDIQTAYSRNLQGLDTANEDRKRNFQDQSSDLQTQTQIQRNALQSALAEKEAGLIDQLSQLQLQKSQAAGQDYNAARAATQGNNARVNALLAQIDQLGLNPSIAAKGDLRFNAPDLAQYNTSNIDVSAASPAQAQAGQFYNLLGLGDDKRKQLV